MIILVLPFFVVSGSYVEKTTWDAFASVVGLNALNKLSANWKVTFNMYDGVIVIPDEPPLEVVYFDYLFWLAMSAYAIESGTSCTDPCEYLVFSS